ncbi:hypothetical protein JM946_09005 [Steroidobacter sp. S1-65]|uniref:Uncharacterized protein n=1 Tax=Steroidobacter gossypii TaxID=2805490 RepID=A0ABS1WV82_9GAMM|nr:hypothetical protein [Steroidobacter gossypii]MBM0104886.1 hypothetical protein [Steroidobacter gossypii]
MDPAQIEIEREKLAIEKKKLRQTFLANTLLTGLLGGIGALIFGILEFDLRRSDLTVRKSDLEFRLVSGPVERIIKDPCRPQAQTEAAYLQTILGTGIVDEAVAPRYTRLIDGLDVLCAKLCAKDKSLCATNDTMSQPASGAAKCDQIVPIRQLGWSAGHKNNFCIRAGFLGVWNKPGASYDSGGFCFKGDADACKRQIEGS